MKETEVGDWKQLQQAYKETYHARYQEIRGAQSAASDKRQQEQDALKADAPLKTLKEGWGIQIRGTLLWRRVNFHCSCIGPSSRNGSVPALC